MPVSTDIRSARPASALTLERLPSVKARTGLSRSEIYRRISTKPRSFPSPIKIGQFAVAWDSRAIDQWILDRIAESDARTAA